MGGSLIKDSMFPIRGVNADTPLGFKPRKGTLEGEKETKGGV